MATKRIKYDWEAIEKEFRAGQLSIREIAKQHGCSDGAIRKKMKQDGIFRDLSARVAEKVRADLVRGEVRTANPESEKEIIDTAAARAVEVIRSHKKRLKASGEIVDVLLCQLKELVDNREGIEKQILQDTQDNPQDRARMLKAVALPANASTLVSLSVAMRNFIDKDRETFGLDAKQKSGLEQTAKDILDAMDGTTKGLPFTTPTEQTVKLDD